MLGCQRRNYSITFLFISVSFNGDEFSRISPPEVFLFWFSSSSPIPPQIFGNDHLGPYWVKTTLSFLLGKVFVFVLKPVTKINFSYQMSQIWIMINRSRAPDRLVIICCFWKPCVYVWLIFFWWYINLFNLSLYFWNTNVFLYCIW